MRSISGADQYKDAEKGRRGDAENITPSPRVPIPASVLVGRERYGSDRLPYLFSGRAHVLLHYKVVRDHS